jgi:hypothetical protein
VYSLDEAGEAFEASLDPRYFKVALKP